MTVTRGCADREPGNSCESTSSSRIAGYVREFHEHVGAAIRDVPIADPPRAAMRCEFIEEEARELRQAVEVKDLVAIADALGDLAYVVYGAALHFGIDLDRVVAEVHRSNMTKTAAGDAKSVKGTGYQRPDLSWLSAESSAIRAQF